MKRIIITILLGFVTTAPFASSEIASEDQPFYGTSMQMTNCAIKHNLSTPSTIEAVQMEWKYFSEEHR